MGITIPGAWGFNLPIGVYCVCPTLRKIIYINILMRKTVFWRVQTGG